MNIKNLIPNETLRRLNPGLFEPRQQPATFHGAEKEKDLHGDIFNECRARGWIALHGSMAERTHRTMGEPDYVILADGGRVFFIECKSKTGKLSISQIAIARHAAKLGHTIHEVRSMEQFLDIVNQKL